MANNLRYRHGPQLLVDCAVDSTTVIEAGDMVYLDTDDVKPATSFTFTTNVATTQANFAAVFVGIANAQSRNGDTDDIAVDISNLSVYEMACASATAEIGDDYAPDTTGATSSDTLMDQTLEQPAAATSAIARCVKRKVVASTVVEVVFASAYNPNNTNAVVG